MKHQPLWYVSRDGKLLGPHPRQVVIDGLLLGRFGWDDPASQDGHALQPLKMYPEIRAAIESLSRERSPVAGEPPSLSWQNERLAAARRWADERTGIDRRTGEEIKSVAELEGADERRSLDERRRERELLQVVIWRRLRRDLSAVYGAYGAYGRSAVSRWWWMPVVVLALAALGAAVWQRAPSTVEVSLAPRVADCAAPAAPGANWSGCERSMAALAGAQLRSARLAGARLGAADLQSADLTYADLSASILVEARLAGARLFGSNLTGADLSGASLEDADLGFADLRNARIEGARFDRARLGNAIWIDGRRCAASSTGRCD